MTKPEQRGKRFQAIYQLLLPASSGGGLVYTIGLIRDGEYQAAAIAFTVSILALFGAVVGKFGKDLFQKTLNEIEARLEKRSDRWSQKIVNQLESWLERTNAKYLERQGNICQSDRVEGTNPSFIPQLVNVFVPLELSGAFFRGQDREIPTPAGFQLTGETSQKLKQADNLRIWHLLKGSDKFPAYRRLVILAWGGYGKTTLLRHITYLYAEKETEKGVPKLLPVFLRLRDWQEILATNTNLSLPKLIEQH